MLFPKFSMLFLVILAEMPVNCFYSFTSLLPLREIKKYQVSILKIWSFPLFQVRFKHALSGHRTPRKQCLVFRYDRQIKKENIHIIQRFRPIVVHS